MTMTTFPRLLRLVAGAALAAACVASFADDAAIRRNWAARNPKSAPIDEISKTPIPGLYELRIDKQIVYSDEQANVVIFPSLEQSDGHLVDTRSKADLTEQRLARIRALDMPRLPYGDAIVFKQGTGARRMVVFEDPNCHYCKDAERNFMLLKDVTIYTFLIPILGDDSVAKSRQIWCSPNNAQAWRSWMTEGQLPPRPMGRCDVQALQRNLDLAARYHLNYTPAILFDDGSRHTGLADVASLTKRLDEVAAAAKKG
jgi:thiol:disulfide interchange protein DsbC